MSEKDGGPAFRYEEKIPYECVSLRDYFAANAMTGMVAGTVGTLGNFISAYGRGPCNEVIVNRAYALADAMLAERKERNADEG